MAGAKARGWKALNVGLTLRNAAGRAARAMPLRRVSMERQWHQQRIRGDGTYFLSMIAVIEGAW